MHVQAVRWTDAELRWDLVSRAQTFRCRAAAVPASCWLAAAPLVSLCCSAADYSAPCRPLGSSYSLAASQSPPPKRLPRHAQSPATPLPLPDAQPAGSAPGKPFGVGEGSGLRGAARTKERGGDVEGNGGGGADGKRSQGTPRGASVAEPSSGRPVGQARARQVRLTGCWFRIWGVFVRLAQGVLRPWAAGARVCGLGPTSRPASRGPAGEKRG
jgi:hypothetical protein